MDEAKLHVGVVPPSLTLNEAIAKSELASMISRMSISVSSPEIVGLVLPSGDTKMRNFGMVE